MRSVCVVCGQEFERDLMRGAMGALYCSSRCAWSNAPRSRESMMRERDALAKVLAEKPS